MLSVEINLAPNSMTGSRPSKRCFKPRTNHRLLTVLELETHELSTGASNAAIQGLSQYFKRENAPAEAGVGFRPILQGRQVGIPLKR